MLVAVKINTSEGWQKCWVESRTRTKRDGQQLWLRPGRDHDSKIRYKYLSACKNSKITGFMQQLSQEISKIVLRLSRYLCEAWTWNGSCLNMTVGKKSNKKRWSLYSSIFLVHSTVLFQNWKNGGNTMLARERHRALGLMSGIVERVQKEMPQPYGSSRNFWKRMLLLRSRKAQRFPDWRLKCNVRWCWWHWGTKSSFLIVLRCVLLLRRLALWKRYYNVAKWVLQVRRGLLQARWSEFIQRCEGKYNAWCLQ